MSENNPIEQSWLKSASMFVLEGVKEHLKGIIGAAVFAIVTPIGLYVWSGQAVWLLPIFIHLLGFLIGVALTLSIVGFVGFRSVLKTRKQAAEFAAGLISKDKGFFDYSVELDELQPQFANAIAGIGAEMGEIAAISGSVDFADLSAGGSRGIVQGLARAARQMVQRTELMTARQSELEILLPRMTEATGHLVASQFMDVNTLPPVRDALAEMIEKTRSTRETMGNWRSTQEGAYGMSQELNTAMNHLLVVTNRIMASLEGFEDQLKQQLVVIDGRLKS